MDKTTEIYGDGIRISDTFECGEVTFPFRWIDHYISYYCFNLDTKPWGVFFDAQPEASIILFSEKECGIREHLSFLGNWEEWLGSGDNPSTKVKLERVSVRVEKAIRSGLGSLALTAVKYSFPCDTSLGNREDNELYSYIIRQLQCRTVQCNYKC